MAQRLTVLNISLFCHIEPTIWIKSWNPYTVCCGFEKMKPKFGHAWKYIAMSFNRFSLCTTRRLKANKPSIEPIWKNRRKNNQWIRVRIKIGILFGCRKTAWALFGFYLIEFLFTFSFQLGSIFVPICYDSRNIGYACMSGDTTRILIFY